ncbi:MAG: hypothetical protein JOZ78_07020 [Chroococcidiopsidaceae cyanobacterium CP_BM_ER_R8_30]|nr:hypothetical protein [Chroococcidiopsidaceae cyanobacterium CP_BM_ER_R8_30]
MPLYHSSTAAQHQPVRPPLVGKADGFANILAGVFLLFLPLSFALGAAWYRRYCSRRRIAILTQKIATLERLWQTSQKQ